MLPFRRLAALDREPDGAGVITLVVLMCSFNRRGETLNALRSLSGQEVSFPILATVVLFDDGSRDGTTGAVIAAFPEVEIVHGDGSAYWSRGMACAQEVALRLAQPDYLCWLNDDVTLIPHALDVLLHTARGIEPAGAVVGPLADAETLEISYSGYVRTGARPTQLQHVVPDGEPRDVDNFNGNVVLLPRVVYERVGSIDARYEHSYGDTDYGYRIAKTGLRTVLAPRVVGHCSRNSSDGTWRDPRLRVVRRLTLLGSRKGIPPRSYAHFQRQCGGRRWPINVAGTYARAIAAICRTSVRLPTSRRSARAFHVGDR